VGGHGSLSLLFVMEVMVHYFVGNCHKVVMITLIVISSNCCGDSSPISYICISVWRIWVHEVPALQIERM